VIETGRLTLRDLEPGDADDLAAIFADDEVMRWIGSGAYLLARDAWGVGYATEAAGAIRDVGLTIRPDLVSLIYPDNTASIKVANKIGMTYEKNVAFAGHELGLYRSPVAS
jgi:RimJ/RimL family protein N-acetyltransferase